MTTLVTGAAGFLGSHVARLLIERGDGVRVLLRPTSSDAFAGRLAAGRVERVVGDLRDAASLDARWRESKPSTMLPPTTGCGPRAPRDLRIQR